MNNRIAHQPEYDALHQFDAENMVEAPRAVAERVLGKYRIRPNDPLVDDVAHAIEDALHLGQRRARFLPPGAQS